MLAASVVLAPNAWSSQGASANLSGRVLDPDGEALPGATVVAVHDETGVQRLVVSGADGSYRIPGLSIGAYTITCALEGFATVERSGVTLGIGQDAVLNFQLQLSGVEETVTVVSDAPLVDTQKSEIGQNIREEQIQNLPVNTREWINLATLTPGVGQDNIRSFYNNANIGGGTRWYSNAFIVDGVTNTWAEMGEPRQNFPMDSIAEFKVTQSLFKAEHGLAVGGRLTAVTKSGTNSFHGSAFVYGRDRSLNSKGFFEAEKPDFRRYQYGGSLGGPVIQNEAFFFGSYERTDLTHFFTVNTRGAFPEVEGTFPKDDFRQMFTGRYDHQLNADHSLSVRYAQEDEHQENLNAGGTRRIGFTQEIPRKSLVANHTWILGDNRLNQLRFQVATAAYQIWPSNAPGSFTDNGVYTAERFDAVNQAINRPSLRGNHTWLDVGPEVRIQVRDDFENFVPAWGGAHTFKAGVDFSHVDFSDDWSGDAKGVYSFATDRPFDPGDPSTHPFLFTAFAPRPLLEAFQSQSFPAEWNTRLKTEYYSLYFQDDWEPTPRLTLNLGLRYDLQTGVFNEDLDTDVSPFIDPGERGDSNNLGPRVGFAYDLGGDGRSVLRGGYGLYYDNIRTLRSFDERRNFQFLFVFIPDPGFPDPFGGQSFLDFVLGGPPSIAMLDNQLVNPYGHQASVGFSQQIASTWALSVDVNYSKILAAHVQRDLNIFPTPGAPRPMPEFGRVTSITSDGEQEYKALFVRLEKRFRGDYQLLTSYTLSSAKDFPDGFPADHDDIEADWGPGETDRRHRFVFSGMLRLPYDIWLSGVADLRSSVPFNVSAGRDLNLDTIGGDRPAGITRNTGCRGLNIAAANEYRAANGLSPVQESDITCPGYYRFDVRGSKRFPVQEGMELEVLVQAFNLFNSANFSTPIGNLLSSSFGQVVSAGEPRQLELAIRFLF